MRTLTLDEKISIKGELSRFSSGGHYGFRGIPAMTMRDALRWWSQTHGYRSNLLWFFRGRKSVNVGPGGVVMNSETL